MRVAATKLTMEPSISTTMEMRARPELCLFSRLLELPINGLEEAIDEELTSNPALVRAERLRCQSCGATISQGAAGVSAWRARPAPPTTT